MIDLQSTSDVLRRLKSRGMIRFVDLNRVNKRNIDDIESDEQEDENHSDAEEMAKRRRIGIEPRARDNNYDMSKRGLYAGTCYFQGWISHACL